MNKDEIISEVLLEIAKIFKEAEIAGNYLGHKEIWQPNLEMTFKIIASELKERSKKRIENSN